MRLGIAALIALALAGCGTRPAGPVGADADHPRTDNAAMAAAADIIRAAGQTPAAVAEATVRIKAPEQDAERFQLWLWCSLDGRVRILATFKDVEFCSAILRADGTYEAWLPRAKLASKGRLDDDADPRRGGLLAALRLAAAEVRDGPLPPAGEYRAGPAPTTLLFAEAGGLSAQATIDPAERTVLSKRLFASDGSELATATYQRWKEFDELRRATSVALAFPGDATEVGFSVRKVESVGDVSEERMRFALPEGAPVVPLREFLAHLGD
jgi:hypothetical protein